MIRAPRTSHSLAVALVPAVLAAFAACDGPNRVSGPAPPPHPPCPSFEDFLHTAAIGRPPGFTSGAAVSGDFLYAASGADGVHIMDISDPANVTVVRTLAVSDARALDVDGTLLYVAAGHGGLVIADVSIPSGASVIATVDMPGRAADVDAVGTRAYVANVDIGMVIVDASSSSSPVILGIDNTPGKAVGVAAREPLAFVADETNGLRIVNVFDPAAPFVLKTVAVPGAALAAATAGNLVLVAAREGGLQIVDASVPADAKLVGSLATPRAVHSVAVSGAIAFLAEGSGGIEVADFSAPASPRRLQALGTAGSAWDVAVNGGRLAVADDNAGARVIDITTPVSPAVDRLLTGGDFRSVATLGDLLVVSDASFGLRVFDTATRTVTGELGLAGEVTDAVVVDSLAYVIADGTVSEVDLRDPDEPALLRAIPGEPVDAVAVKGEFIYQLASSGTLVERRLDGTGIPRVFSAFDAFFPSLTIEDPYIYLSDRRGNVWIVVRSTMKLASLLPMGASTERVLFRREDVPFAPPIVRGWVAQSGLVNGQAAIEVYDFANIFFPQLVRTIPCAGTALDVAFAGTRLIVAEGDDGCEIFEFAADGSARPVGYLPEPALRVAALGNRFAVAAGSAGLILVEFSGCLAAR